MTILDRTIARHFLTNAAVLMLILFSFVVAVDVSLNFDKFAQLAAERGASPGGREPSVLRQGVVAVALVFDLWWPRLLQLFNYMLGLVMVGAMGFTLAQMVKHRELVAMLSGGLSLWRAARPILVCAAVLSALQLVNQELILPRVAPLLTRDHNQAGLRTLGSARVKPTADDQGRIFYDGVFDADSGVWKGVHVLERDATGVGVRSITAAEAVYRGGGWQLTDGRAVSLRQAGGLPEVVASIPTRLDPTALTLRRFAGYRNSLSWRQIGEMVDRPDLLADRSADLLAELDRIRYGRLGVVACNLMSMLICLPFFLRREPAVMVGPALKCAPLALTALLAGVLGSAAAIPGLPPQLSVFVPAVVLLPIAIAATTAVRT